jgi:D-3-phosphoglycerate dehydrogenase
MANYRVLVPVTAPSTEVGSRYAFEMEALTGFDVEFMECHASETEFVSVAERAHSVYVRGVRLTRGMIAGLDECRVIVVGSVGVDHVDVDAATERGIPVANCPDTFTEEVADHAMMLLLSVHRRALEQDQLVRTAQWNEGRERLLQIPRLRGQTLGLLGFGRVARAVASRARGFGLRVITCDPFVDEAIMVKADVEPVCLSDLLTRADYISLHVPDTPATRGLLGEAQFRQMKAGTVIINTGRGSTIVEAALIKALDLGWIAGAGLDVFAVEPLEPENPLLTMTNVILSPHNASASARFDPARRRRVGQELGLVLGGWWPMSCVNPAVLSKSGLRPWRSTLT